MATQIFISYSHDNTAQLKAFVDALRPVARQRGWEIWYDDRVTAGRHLDETIKAAIAQSNVFLCFVSQAFLNSKYIREEELPRIRDAVETRGALTIPVIVEECFWKVECDGPRSVPLDPRGKLRPITGWAPHSKGHHAAAVQVIDGIDAHLGPPVGSGSTPAPPIPDDEPGPKIRRVADRFDVVDAPPPETERKDPGQIRQHKLLCRRIERVSKSLEIYRDSWEYLCQEFDDYREFASVSLDEIDLPSLIHAGNGLSAMVQASYRHDTTKTNTPALEPQVVALLEALLEDHALFVSGFEEGRELRARAAENRLQGEDQKDVRDRTETVLRELDRPADLLGPKAKKLVASSLLALENGEWAYRDLVETSAALAANGLIGMGREVAPWLGGGTPAVDTQAGEAAPVSTDAVPAAVTSAIAFFSRANDAVAAIAAAPDIRRFVTWIGEAAQTYTTRKEAGGEEGSGDREGRISSTPNFSEEAVHEMILRGEEIPDNWVARVTALTFIRQKQLRNLAPLAKLTRLGSLIVFGCPISDLSPLSGLSVLRKLFCWDTSITDLLPLSRLRSLETLACSATSVSDLSPLSGLSALRQLECWNTSVSDLSPLSGLRSLKTLNCSGTSVSDLSPLSGLRGLSTLACARTSVTDLSPLSDLTALRMLDCSHTSVPDLSPVSGLTSLAALDASYLDHDVRWPKVWPESLQQLNLSGSSWPKQRRLPDVPWLIAPDGTVRRGEGEDPAPFRWWLPNDLRRPPEPPEG